MASHSPTHKSKEEKEKRKSAAKAKIRAIGMVQAAFKRAQQRQGTESPEPVNSGEEPRLTWRERMAERAKERGGTAARGGDETARSSRTFSDPPSDPQSTHQWQARKLEERAKVEKRRKEEARALTRRDADRRARTSDRDQDPFEAELDRMSDAEAMNRLDDVPISDLDTDYSSDERGASRRGGRGATDNDDSDLDDGLTPMERAMARAARARAASAGEESSGGELPERPAARKDPPPAPRHPPPPRDCEEPRERRGGDAESRAIDADERARRAEAELADATRRIRELERRLMTAERRAEVAEKRSAARSAGAPSVGAPPEPGLPTGPSWLAPAPADVLERRPEERPRERTRIEVREEREEEPPPRLEIPRRVDPPAREPSARAGIGRLDLSAVASDVEEDAPRVSSRGDISARTMGGGEGAAVGATGDGSMRHEVSRLKKSAKQSLDKERAMVDQLNALRRAKGQERVAREGPRQGAPGGSDGQAGVGSRGGCLVAAGHHGPGRRFQRPARPAGTVHAEVRASRGASRTYGVYTDGGPGTGWIRDVGIRVGRWTHRRVRVVGAKTRGAPHLPENQARQGERGVGDAVGRWRRRGD